MDLLSIKILAFIPGFLIGRAGHYYIGHKIKCIHHWIYGILIIVVALQYVKNEYRLNIIFFGIGIFISDLRDFFHFKIYGKDIQEKTKFLGID